MRTIFLSAMLVAPGAVTATAQASGSSGWVPALELRVQPSRPEGSYTQAFVAPKLVKGRPATVTVWTGRSLCDVGIGSGEPMQVPSPPSNVWKMSADYLGESAGRYQIRVTSGFTRTGDRDASDTTTQTLSLQDGDSVVLEALNAPLEAPCQVHTVTFNARLAMQATDPALARARYTADMWLVHTDPDGKEQREHLVMNIDGSLVMPFMFNRLAFPIPQVDPRQGNAEAVIQLTGALRARPRADGLVDLDVETNRLLFGLENPDGPIRSVPTTVRKTLTIKENETTAVDFPAPATGYSAIALDQDTKTVKLTVRKVPLKVSKQITKNGTGEDIVVVKENKLFLFTDKFFKGHTTRLLITLKPLR